MALPTRFRCRLPLLAALWVGALAAAQRQLLQDGTLARLLKRYGGSLTPKAP